jgi:hypothetical protein
MSFRRLISPDKLLGKTLITVRCWLDMLWYLIRHPSPESLHLVWAVWRIKPKYTMVTSRNLVSLYSLVKRIDIEALPGDIVECGVWNGGSSALMGYSHFKGHASLPRTFWLFDSFAGLPEPGDKDGKLAGETYYEGYCLGSEQKVMEVIQKLKLPADYFRMIRGWFQDTLPETKIDPIALLHVDADWYDSVKLALDTYYDHITPGGYIALDDYGYWEGCKRAVDEFFEKRKVDPPIQYISKTGIYIQKPKLITG